MTVRAAMTMAAWLAALVAGAAAENDRASTVIVVVGAAGSDEYASEFAKWAARWKSASERGGATFVGIGVLQGKTETVAVDATKPAAPQESSQLDDRELLEAAIEQVAAKKDAGELWLVLIGHGTFDGKKAKFNLRGPDIAADDLAEWLKLLDAPTAIVNCASSSGPFINRLSAANRVVITATKSGHERNFARFGDYLSAAIGDDSLDLDKDEQTSLVEAFVAASVRTAEFYKQESRLATEHPLVDDNGDGLGTPAEWFRGYRTTRQAKAGATPDGAMAGRFVLVRRGQEATISAELRKRRDAIETQIERLRTQKGTLDEREYFERLETLLVELAECYDAAEATIPLAPNDRIGVDSDGTR